MITDTDKAYAAGIIDGEGNVSVLRRTRPKLSRIYHYVLQVQVSQSEIPILEWLVEKFGSEINGHYQYANSLKPGSPIYHWQLFGAAAKDFLIIIEPFLIRNKRKAILAKDYPTGRTKNHLTEEDWEQQEFIYKMMRI